MVRKGKATIQLKSVETEISHKFTFLFWQVIHIPTQRKKKKSQNTTKKKNKKCRCRCGGVQCGWPHLLLGFVSCCAAHRSQHRSLRSKMEVNLSLKQMRRWISLGRMRRLTHFLPVPRRRLIASCAAIIGLKRKKTRWTL